MSDFEQINPEHHQTDRQRLRPRGRPSRTLVTKYDVLAK
jgi:hypothetical protein